MAFEVTTNALAASLDTSIQLQIVLEIEGFDKIYGATDVKKFIRYGDEGLEYGDGSTYGGLNSVEEQGAFISFSSAGGGTSTTIRQQLNVDKGTGDSISSISVTLIDKDGEVSRELITPDETTTPATDVLGRRAKVWLGFADVSWPEDFFVVFRGTIDSVDTGAGYVRVNLNSPDSKKKGEIFTRATTELTSALGAGDTVANVDDTTDFLDPTFTGPDGTIDDDLTYYFIVGSGGSAEIIKYEAKSATQLQTLTRGQFGTPAQAHSSGDSVESIYVLGGDSGGNSIDIALKLMSSGIDGFYEEDREVTAFVRVDGVDLVDNAVFFEDLDPVQQFNLQVGDFATVTGATEVGNNVSGAEVVGITESLNGYYITLDDSVTLVEEINTSAVISFRSQYDVFPVGAEMINDEIDIEGHLDVQRTFLSDTDTYQFLLKDEIELKTFLGEQIYNPVGAFSIPRKARAGVGFHLAGLLPGGTIKELSDQNVKNASKLKVTRSTSKNFFNAVVYKFDEDSLEEDKFTTVISTLNTDSRDRIKVGVRALVIEAKGLRSNNGGENIADEATSRRLNKYKFGAEFIKGLKLNFKTGFNLEVGDVILFDFASLKVTDIKEGGSREGDFRLMQIDNKSLNMKTGEITLDITDTNFDQDNRFCLIGPSSFVKSGVSTTQFIIEPSFNTDRFGNNEFRKWEDYVGSEITVRSEDGSVIDASVLSAVNGNLLTVETALSFTPSAGQLVVFGDYQATQPLSNVKLIYGSQFDGISFPDSSVSYKMI